MRLLAILFGSQRQVTRLANLIASRCQATLWARVWQNVATMPEAEARGYIRSHAINLVENEFELFVIGQRDGLRALRPHIIELARAVLTEQVLNQALTVEAPAVIRRAA